LPTPQHGSAIRTSVNVSDHLLADLDRVWEAQDLDNWSRAVREATLEDVEAHDDPPETTGEGRGDPRRD